MFERATKKLVRQIDPNGALIAARLNDSKKTQLLAVVLKKQKMWFWQQTTYRPTSFTLNDLLEGKEIKPVRDEKEFLKYEGTYKSVVSGSMEVGNGAVGLNVSGQGKSKLHLSLGSLKKEDMDIPKLLKDSKGRKVDLTHSLIQQSLKRKRIFTLVKERVFTTCECSISYTGLEQGSCFSALKGHSEMVFMKERGDLQYDSDLALNIPPGTVMAYSVIEMSISSDGNFDLYVEPDGLEVDDISEDVSEVDGPRALQEIKEGSLLSSLKEDVQSQTKFFALTDLSSECRYSLLLHLRKILLDRPVLSALVDRLEVLSSGEAQFLLNSELTDNQSCLIDEVLDLLKCEPFNKSGIATASVANQNGSQMSKANHRVFSSVSESNGSYHRSEKQNGCHTPASHQNGTSTKSSKQSERLKAMHMLLSALEELTDAGLKLLESFCCSEGLTSLRDLVNLLMANCMPLSKDAIPAFIQKDKEFYRVVDLFKSCNVLLRREDNLIFNNLICGEGFLPLVLCIVISGIACLSDSNKDSTVQCSQNN